jgi:hypothetical protein
MKRILALVPVIALGVFGTFIGDVPAAVNGPGIVFKAAFPEDAGCLSVSSYGGIVNNCATARWVKAALPISEGWHPTSVSIYGNSSMCYTVSTNGVGNGAHIGADTWTLAGPKAWQTLNTGDRYVWSWSPLLFSCLLESGGTIGSFSAQ